MNKIFKKSLALTVSAALCLTAFIGCLSVSAETPVASSATITVKDTTIAPGATGDVDVEFANVGDICATLSTITFPEGFVINSIKDNAEKQLFKVLDETDGGNVTINKNVLKFCEIINFAGQISTTNVILTINVTAPETAGTYTVKVGESSANYDEKFLAITTKEGTVTVASSHVHDYKVVSAEPATETSDGTITLKCACGVEDTTSVTYNSRYVAATTSAECGVQVALCFNVRLDRLNENTNYSDAFVRFNHNISDYGPYVTYKYDCEDSVVNGRDCKTWKYPIKSMQMTERVSAIVFVLKDGKWYSGKSKEYSIRDYADSLFESSTDGEVKAVLANMLVYGSKMQKYKSYNLDNLADANLGNNASYITTTEPSKTATITKDYDNKTDPFINSYVIDAAEKTKVNFKFRTDRYVGENKDNLRMVASWSNGKGFPFTAEYVNSSGNIPIGKHPYSVDSTASGANRYVFDFEELSSYDWRSEVTFTIFDGETALSTYRASIEALIANVYNTSSNEVKAVYDAMLNYGDASIAYFCK